MLNLFKSAPLLEKDSAEWMFDTFAWALTHFDSEEFFKRSRLIQPSNEFFPGRVDNVHAKAENIFQHCLNYSGLKHWPLALQAPEYFQNIAPQPLQLEQMQRQSGGAQLPAIVSNEKLQLTYNPQQTLKPEDLASSFAHGFAQHLVMQSQQLPPGGADYFTEATELVGIFMGFGVMFANSAYTFRGGCGSCYNGAANRQATLSENEVVFALALFCRLKNIPTKEASQHLKSHLKGAYKKAIKQIDAQPEQLARLLKYQHTPQIA